MASNLPTVMTWKQASDTFEREILPNVSRRFNGDLDEVAARETWNNWTDSLCKNNMISDWQYANWSHPAFLSVSPIGDFSAWDKMPGGC
jgi:hypothetical protein